MEDKKSDEKLYMAVNVPDSADLVAGIGNKELTIIGISLAIAVVMAIVIYASVGDEIAALIAAGILLTLVIVCIRRDPFNESLIDKLKIVINYHRAQKQYVYSYYNIYEDEYGKNNSK